MDKRILLVIACFWMVALSIFFYKKVYSSDRLKKPVYTTSIKNNTTAVGEKNTFRDITEGAVRWKWNFGDDQYSFEQKPEHIYTEPGNYTITLTAYGSFGHIKDATKSITVLQGRAPDKLADLTIAGPETITQGASATFNAPVDAESYEWKITGEPKYTGRSMKTEKINLVFNTPGRKELNLKLHNPNLSLSKIITVTVAHVKSPPKREHRNYNKPAPHKEPVPDDWIDAKDL